MNKVTIVSTNVGPEALDFNISNNLLYCITTDGRILTKYYYRDINTRNNIFVQNSSFCRGLNIEWNTIMILNAFPLDSIVFNNKLVVATTEDVYTLPLSWNYKEVNLHNFSSIGQPIRSIGISKCKKTLFFSLDAEGLLCLSVDPDTKTNELIHIPSPSTQTLIAKDKLLNLHPDKEPYIMTLNSIAGSEQSENNGCTALCKHKNKIDDFINIEGIVGRNIIAPYTDGRIFALPTYKGDGRFFLNKSRKRETLERNRSFFYTYSKYIENKKLIDYQYDINIPSESMREFPLSILHHPLGMVEEYFNHVDFVDFSGNRHELIKDTEIAQVRTYNDNSAYSSLVTVAAESGCWIFDVIESKDEIDYEVIPAN